MDPPLWLVDSLAMDHIQLSWANVASYDEQSQDAEKRKPGRVVCEHLGCGSGRVLDLSMTGARIRIRSLRPPRKGERRELDFKTVTGESVSFPCRIAWVRRIVWTRYELGVEFTDLSETRTAELAEIARVHSDRSCISSPADLAA